MVPSPQVTSETPQQAPRWRLPPLPTAALRVLNVRAHFSLENPTGRGSWRKLGSDRIPSFLPPLINLTSHASVELTSHKSTLGTEAGVQWIPEGTSHSPDARAMEGIQAEKQSPQVPSKSFRSIILNLR